MSELGPCVLCGTTGYELSYGGPTICPSCDCGINPEISKIRNAGRKLVLENKRLTAEIEALKQKPCPNIISSDEGTNYCSLAEDNYRAGQQQGIKEGMFRAAETAMKTWPREHTYASPAQDQVREIIIKAIRAEADKL